MIVDLENSRNSQAEVPIEHFWKVSGNLSRIFQPFATLVFAQPSFRLSKTSQVSESVQVAEFVYNEASKESTALNLVGGQGFFLRYNLTVKMQTF